MPHSEPVNGSSTNGSRPERRGVYLLTHPRSASNLFQRMMEAQPGVQGSGYQFFNAAFPMMMSMEKGPLSSFPEAEREALYAPYHDAFKAAKAELDGAKEKGLQVFVKEHACLLASPDKLYASVYEADRNGKEPWVLCPADTHTNPSFLPDDFLLSMQPIFQIRHPAAMFPSLVRTQKKIFADSKPSNARFVALLTLRYSRALYDWYSAHELGIAPKVIDADDIMNNPAAVRQLCDETGLDPNAVQYEWETREEPDPMKVHFLSTLNASKGIKSGLQARDLDIETEKTKWVEEFGQQDADDLAKTVYEAMPDYEYLLKRRVRGSQ